MGNVLAGTPAATAPERTMEVQKYELQSEEKHGRRIKSSQSRIASILGLPPEALDQTQILHNGRSCILWN